MSKVTSKRQVTVPKEIADQYGISPGDDIGWQPAGDTIRVIPPREARKPLDREARLRLFDQATERQVAREAQSRASKSGADTPPDDRGWKREDLYDRGRTG
jgi:AbrB family looped-hinge helix DNA binding protein